MWFPNRENPAERSALSRGFLSMAPALALAVMGLGAVTVATVAPSAGEPAAVFFLRDIPADMRFQRVAALGGRYVDTSADGGIVYAVFDDVPDLGTAWASGIAAVVDATGAAGCTGQAPKLGLNEPQAL